MTFAYFLAQLGIDPLDSYPRGDYLVKIDHNDDHKPGMVDVVEVEFRDSEERVVIHTVAS